MNIPTDRTDEQRRIDDAVDALALWEMAIDCPRIYEWLTGDEGAGTGRDQAVKVSPTLGRAYERSEFPDGYDWDFLPLFFDALFELAPECIPTPGQLTQEIADATAKAAVLIWAGRNQ